jgi:hypothetical protein
MEILAKIDTFYFDDSNIRFFPSCDVQAMADAALREMPIKSGYEYVDRHS